MAKTFGAIVVIVLLLVCAGDFRVFGAPPPQAAQDVELSGGWKLESASTLGADGKTVSSAGYDDSAWHPVRRMPATVLQTLQDDGVYPNLYYGKNLLTEVPQDLYKQDWWYRTTFDRAGRPADLPAGLPRHQLPRRHLAQRPPRRRQPPDRRDVQRPPARRHPVDPAGQAEHPRGQGHPRAGHPGRRRCRAGRQLVRLDQLALSGLPGAEQESRQRKLVRPRPQRRHLETGVPQDIRRRRHRRGHRQHRAATAGHRQRAADRLRRPAQLLPRAGERRAARNDHPRRQGPDPRRRTRLAEGRRGTRDQLHPG